MRAGLLILFLSIVFSITAFGQTDCSVKNMIEKIDSIANVNGIDKIKIYFNRVTSIGESTSTEKYCIEKEQEYKFDGEFLVIDDTYYNMRKLLYFVVKEDYLIFYFQAY